MRLLFYISKFNYYTMKNALCKYPNSKMSHKSRTSIILRNINNIKRKNSIK